MVAPIASTSPAWASEVTSLTRSDSVRSGHGRTPTTGPVLPLGDLDAEVFRCPSSLTPIA